MEGLMEYIRSKWAEILIMGIGLPVIGYYAKKKLSKNSKEEQEAQEEIISASTITNSNVNNISLFSSSVHSEQNLDKERRIENMRSMVSILFIDDDVKFKVIAILKNAGWVQTRIVKDLKNLNEPTILNAHIVFVDIQGVGKQMGFPDEGLGLAASIKEKYSKKKVIIYSADSEGSRFHKAFRLADDQLSKNAVPYEFENVIETMTTQLMQNGVL